MLTPERLEKLEDKVDKLSDTVTDVNVKVEKLITRLDIVLDQHGTAIKKHDTDIECLKNEMHERTWFRSKTSKIIAIISALATIIFGNLILDLARDKIEENKAQQKVSINSQTNQNIYK